MTLRSKTLAAAAFVAALASAAPSAHAADPAAATVARAVELNREGIAFYEKAEFEAARASFEQALALCEGAGLDRHPVAARTHVHLGILAVGGFGKKELARREFSAALAIVPDIALTPGVASPEVQSVFDETRAALAAPAAAAPPAEADDNELPRPIANTRTQDVFRIESRAARRAEEAKTLKAKGEEEDDDDDVPSARLQLSALVGAGTGWQSGYGDVNADTPVPGSFASTRLDHAVVEAGFWLTKSWMLSARGRLQWISGATELDARGRTYAPAAGALAGFAAATWSPPLGHVRPYVSASAGAGRIRHVVTFGALQDCGPTRTQVCVDTVRSGPLFGAASAGLSVDLGAGDHVSLVVGATAGVASAGAPFNLDLDGGLAFHL
jgi:tetratricopeptide (TPR) repeat protein